MAFDAQSFVERYLASPPVPARRTNKNRSGRSVHRRRNNYTVGRVSWVAAVYDGNDRAEVPKDMCEVADHEVVGTKEPRVPLEYKPQGRYTYVGRVDCV